MSRATFIVRHDADRVKLSRMMLEAPRGVRVEIKQARRSIPQNSMLWACLTDLSEQLEWNGQKLSADDWKLVMLDALKRELRVVQNIDGTGFVSLGRSSSDLTKAEMVELIELILAFGAQHGVRFHDEARAA